MAKEFPKRNLTTGDIAKLCGVNFRTVIRWIQRGHLKAFQLPGRGDNRVQLQDFLQFLRENNMPIPPELQPSSRRVLIVEPDEKEAKSYEKAITKAGFETAIASDSFSAGSLANSFVPAVIVIEPGMTGLGGVDVVSSIRANPELATSKVVVVTDMSQAQQKAAEKKGADAVLTKPVKAPDLVEAVQKVTGGLGGPF